MRLWPTGVVSTVIRQGAFMTVRKPPFSNSLVGSLRGEALWRALGFRSERSFQRAKEAGKIAVPLYPILGQSRGVYALRADVEKHREKIRRAPRGEGTDMS